MLTFIFSLLLLSSIGRSFAANVTAHVEARSRNATTTLIQQKRQNGVIVTRLSTVFLSGEVSKTRTANPGYDCRIDLGARLWGFCPTAVIAASDCGLAGSCVDNHACSKGCGYTNQDFTTFTCKDPGNDYCSTALLMLSNRDLGAFTYIACGKAPITDAYMAYATDAIITYVPTNTQGISTSTTGAPASTSSLASQTAAAIASSASLTSTAPSASGPAEPKGGSDSSNNNNLGAIVGGVVGSLAVLCGSVVAIVWLLRRNRKEKALAMSSPSLTVERDMVNQTGSSDASVLNEIKYPDVYGSERGLGAPTYAVQELEPTEYRGWKPPQELSSMRSPRELSNTWVESMPVELPAGSVYWKGGSGHGNVI
ncbi:hypothetical protein GE21DRAFT_1281687 [Neurospora crassa]|nr:hypothetical protein GE21DRAFT_1281687 [Neurospora crassa]